MSKNHLTVKSFVSLHFLFVLYSLTDLFGKLAAGYSFSQIEFYACYGALLLILFIYAIGWQQIIKHLPLTTAFSNRAITVFWGLVWGVLFFAEELTPLKVAGCIIVIIGVLLFVRADASDLKKEQDLMQKSIAGEK